MRRDRPCPDGGIGGGAKWSKDQQYFIAFDQPSRLLHGFRRTVSIIIGDEVDLPTVDAAVVIDHSEVGAHRLANGTVGRCWPAVRHDVADLDLGVGHAGAVLPLGGCAACEQRECGGKHH